MTTFHLHVLDSVPDVSFHQIVASASRVVFCDDPTARIERSKLITDFFESCIAFLDNQKVSSAINPLFDWRICRTFWHYPAVRPLVPPETPADPNPGLFERLLLDCGNEILARRADMRDSAFSMLRLCCNVTSYPQFGKPLAYFLVVKRWDDRAFQNLITELLFPNFSHPRKLMGHVYRLMANLAFLVPDSQLEAPPELPACVGTNSPYIDIAFIRDLLTLNLYIPCMTLRF
jgi:hypothetical protein